MEAAFDDTDLPDARQQLLAALAHDPRHVPALRKLSEFDLAADDAPSAVRWAKRLIDAAPEVGAHHRILGDAYALQQRMPRARAAWRRARELRDRVAEARLSQPSQQTPTAAPAPERTAEPAQHEPAQPERGMVLVVVEGGLDAKAYHQGRLLGSAPGVFMLPVGRQVVQLIGEDGAEARVRIPIRRNKMARAKVAF